LFDEDDCTGKTFDAPVGYSELSTLTFKLRKDDAEAAAVRAGCVLTVYDEADEDEPRKRGEKKVLDNKIGTGLLISELGELREDVESMNCTCYGCAAVT